MKKNGFTLMELLAVILILAVLTTIIVPVVTKQINNSRDKTRATQLAMIKAAAKDWALEHTSDIGLTQKCITVYELQQKGYLEKGKIKDPKTKQDLSDQAICIINNGNSYTFSDLQSDTETYNNTLISKYQEIIAKGTDSNLIATSEENTYIYRGANPNNYIKINGDIYRIVSISNAGFKIVKSAGIAKNWDNTTSEDTKKPYATSYLNTKYFNTTFLNKLSSYQNIIVKTANWNAGSIDTNGVSINSLMYNESQNPITSSVGLLTISDYLNASSNSTCLSEINTNFNSESCKLDNYLNASDSFWLLNITDSGTKNTLNWIVKDGKIGTISDQTSILTAFPVMYLDKINAIIKDLSATGSLDNPYVIAQPKSESEG